MKYSDQIADWLVKLGYTHCFYVGGGNIMHLTDSLSKKLTCVPVIHEVAASIAAEYFNESSEKDKALALVTAGPGLTNAITGIAGAYLESRELLVIGGQVKTADLARGSLRQRGIQEIDGVSIAKPITTVSKLVDIPIDFDEFSALVRHKGVNRPGPVFLEIPIDIQARDVNFPEAILKPLNSFSLPKISEKDIGLVADELNRASRPAILLGGGVTRSTIKHISKRLEKLGVALLTTWNAADRIPCCQANYMGRPNTWGQRSANLVMQQADMLLAIGTRLGMQQTGFNWKAFVPNGRVIQIDLDRAELEKGHPEIDKGLLGDANQFLSELLERQLDSHDEWLRYCRSIREKIPLVEPINKTKREYISPYSFVQQLSDLCNNGDMVIPCSSGGAFTVMMQVFEQKSNQKIITDKGLASMGYGLSGAIGASFANPESRVILVEGDGGFSQNIQEIGTAAINQINLKIFIFDDSGYASIRATQRNYFGGSYVGCDRLTGLGLPNWEKLFSAWDVPVMRLDTNYLIDNKFKQNFNSQGIAAFIVPIDPEQTYFPKITSRITENGSMESNPLHLMTPDLPKDVLEAVAKYF